MQMKMVDMKMSKAEMKKRQEPMSIAGDDAPVYPWGLTVNLDNDAVEKLGLDEDLPDVGESMMLMAKVNVTSVSSNESSSGKNRSVTLQITDLCVCDPDDAGEGDVEKALYGTSKAKA